MSLIINAKGDQFAYVNNAQDKREGTVSFSESTDGDNIIELEDGFKFCLAPRPVKEKERTTLLIAGWKISFYTRVCKTLQGYVPKESNLLNILLG
jgi:hypothetical protein